MTKIRPTMERREKKPKRKKKEGNQRGDRRARVTPASTSVVFERNSSKRLSIMVDHTGKKRRKKGAWKRKKGGKKEGEGGASPGKFCPASPGRNPSMIFNKTRPGKEGREMGRKKAKKCSEIKS